MHTVDIEQPTGLPEYVVIGLPNLRHRRGHGSRVRAYLMLRWTHTVKCAASQ